PAARLAEDAEVELQVRIVAGEGARLLDVLLRLRPHPGPLLFRGQVGAAASAALGVAPSRALRIAPSGAAPLAGALRRRPRLRRYDRRRQRARRDTGQQFPQHRVLLTETPVKAEAGQKGLRYR